ncbi:MAG: Crp/Fnr family transcriptional regulator [Chitinophagaceae bacterium]|nr:Crp/Fnr family transcriptional regulator [Chitinophagaceae bacterium]
MDQLFLLFDRIRPLSPELKTYIRSHLVRKVVKKGEIILREGQVARNIYFIEQGTVRSFRYKKGKERTAWIMKEGDLFVSVGGFFSQTPAGENIEALEDCILHYITFEQLEKAYDDYPEFDRHGRKILTYYYELAEKRNEMREFSAMGKFEFLMKYQPELIGRVRQKTLASYLGMAPETFSVQKSKFANKMMKKKLPHAGKHRRKKINK